MRTTLIERVLRVVYNTEFMLTDDEGILAYNDMFVFTISEDLCVQVKYGDVILLDKTFKSSFACARFLMLNEALLYKEALRYLNHV